MTSQRIRRLGAIVGLIGLCVAPASYAATTSSDETSGQIERRLSKDDALRDVSVSVQQNLVTLSGTVPTL